MYLSVEQYPLENQGCFCRDYRRALVWDCAIVSQLLESASRQRLFGNSLGNTPEATDVRRKITSEECSLVEIGPNPTSPPVDVVIQAQESRTWISNIKPPDIESLLASLAAFYCIERPSVVYTDQWMGVHEIRHYVAYLSHISPKLLYYNVGDCSNTQMVLEILRFLRGPVVIQMSLKDDTQLDKLSELAVGEKQVVIITRDSRSVIVVQTSSISEVPVWPLQSVITTGAGAIFSASMIDFLSGRLDDWLPLIPKAVSHSVACTRTTLMERERAYFL
jgi:hypothetical protein